MPEAAACVCGETRTTGTLVTAKDEISDEKFTYVRCASCGSERLSPCPPASAICDYYPKTYSSHSIRPDSIADKVKRLIYLAFHAPENRLGALRPLICLLLYPFRGHTVLAFRQLPIRRVFEFGAGAGNDLVMFKAEGWEVQGCEPSMHACAIAAERGIQLRNCPAEAVELAPESVSCVLMNNVLEHLYDPAHVLAVSHDALIPGGALVLVLPNHASWTAALFGAAWPGYDAPRHLWGFTPRSLSQVLTRIGFKPPTIYHLFAGRWSWRSTLDGGRTTTPVAAWRIRYAALLSLALFPCGMLAAAMRHGDFMTVVAYK